MRLSARRWPLAILRAAVIGICLAPICQGEDGYTPDPPCNNVVPWDVDCDAISDRTELNPTNSHHGFRVNIRDPNPSIARGTPEGSDGALEGGIDLATPDNGNGYYESGYYEYQSGDVVNTDHWGTLALVNTIEKVGRSWWGSYDGREPECWFDIDSPRFGVGDMSLQAGGSWKPDHDTHRNGRDVDVRYIRSSGTREGENATLNIVDFPAEWDAPISTDLVFCFGATPSAGAQVEVVLVSYVFYDRLATPPVWLRRRATDHADHFHVRIVDPDGPNND